MTESVMRQGMKTWLKAECVDTGIALSNERKHITRIRDYLIDGDYDSAESIIDRLKGNMEFHARKGYIDPELPSIIYGKIRDLINDFRMGEPPTEFERIRVAIGKFQDLTDEADLRLFESVVECQIGKGGAKVAKDIPGKDILIGYLERLEGIAGYMSKLYETYPNLNDDVDIQKIVPMSLDDWELAIGTKVDELKGQ